MKPADLAKHPHATDSRALDRLTSCPKRSEVLVFRLGKDAHGVDMARVQALMGFQPLEPLGEAPFYLRGAIKFRDTPVPVIDLGLKLGLTGPHEATHTCVVVLSLVLANQRACLLGCMVGEVEGVACFDGSDFGDALRPDSCLRTLDVVGAGKTRVESVTLLNVDTFLRDEAALQPPGS